MTLPANIAERIDAAIRNNGSLVGAQAMQALRDLFAELAAERDRYRDALLARHGGEPLALLSELDAARAERDAAVAKCAAVTAQRDALLDFARDVRSWLADPKLSTWTYMEGSEFYADKDQFVHEADEAIARAQPEQPQQPQDGAPTPWHEAHAQLAVVTAQRDAFAKWIEANGRYATDWACSQCNPYSPDIVQGFACTFHEALAIARAQPQQPQQPKEEP